VATQPAAVRRSIGLVFQEPTLDDRLTAFENLEFHARIYNVPDALWRARARTLLDIVELTDRRDHLVKTFSGGMRRRLEIARGLLHQPRVLFLDEPTVGLDPQTRRHIWQYVLELHRREGVTLFLTTHYIEEAEACDQIAVMDHGTIVAQDSPAGLKRLVEQDVVVLESPQPSEAAEEVRARFQLDASLTDGRVEIRTADGMHLIPRLIGGLAVPVTGVSLRRPTLEDVFVKLTGSAIREQEGDGTGAARSRMAAMHRR
jgi:ABC-2 type transport system ATP-binding protein